LSSLFPFTGCIDPATRGPSPQTVIGVSGTPEVPVVITRTNLGAGRFVAERPPAAYGEGTHTVVWDPGLPHSGVYFVRVQTAQGLIAARRWVVTR